MEEIEKTNDEILEKIDEEKYQEGLDKLGDAYLLLIKILKRYCDLEERYYNLVALWIIGTYFHKEFITYPYLFFNAMKGSGKTRTLNLISKLMHKGKLQVNMTESVLFRQAEQYGFCIDEIERINHKEYAPLRELLNTAYKKGMNIERSKKAKDKDTGESAWVIESFKVFTPICMANIRGIDSVLMDRSVVLVLSKSQNYTIVRSIETFDFDDDISNVKMLLKEGSSVVSAYLTIKNVLKRWNVLIRGFYNNNILTTTPNNTTTPKPLINTENSHTHNENNTTPNYTRNYTKNENSEKNEENLEKTGVELVYSPNLENDEIITFFERVIAHTTISGRDLELFLPLFIIANLLKGGLLDDTIETAQKIIVEKREEDVATSRDVQVIDFVAREEETGDFVLMKGLLTRFKEFLQEEQEETKYLNSQWLGRGFKRLGLILKKRRLSNGVEVILDYKKAKEQIKIFKTIPKEEDIEVKENVVDNKVQEDIKEAIKEYEDKHEKKEEKEEVKEGLDKY